VSVLKIRTLNFQKTNLIEKGIGTLLVENQFLNAIKKYLFGIKFDLVLYSTPPITFTKVVKFIKSKDSAKSYLLLKDIFPQNAVDLGILKNAGLLHRFFRLKEMKMYEASDFIGCMSPANVKYILKHNSNISSDIVEVCPNSIEIDNTQYDPESYSDIRELYKIPVKSTIFIYGGNLGKPQGLDFLLEVIESNNNKSDRFFIIIGSGIEFKRISEWFKLKNITNAILLKGLPKIDYDNLVRSCDVGLIFLDKRFSIPNYPSRLLSYMEFKMPILVATDENSDMGAIAEANKYGLFTVNGNLDDFNSKLDLMVGNETLIREMGENGHNFMLKNYTVDKSFQIIMKHFS
jgi:glycosyltransferase involved in cell wall biosynthesis